MKDFFELRESLQEAKIEVGDRVRVKDDAKKVVDRKLLGKSGVVVPNPMGGRSIRVKFVDGRSAMFNKNDLEVNESVELDEARAKQAVAGNKVQKLVTGFDMTYKGKKYDEIDMELVKIDNGSEIVTFKILHPREHIGDEVKIPFKTLRRGRFMATDTSKINEAITADTKYGRAHDKAMELTDKAKKSRKIDHYVDAIKAHKEALKHAQSATNKSAHSGHIRDLSSKLIMAEETELDETKGSGVKKFVRGMRVQNLNGSKGTVIKGGDNMKKAVEVEWDSGQTTLASAKYLKSINKNESVELDEAINTYKDMDKGRLETAKNSIERSLASLRMKLKKSSAYGGNKAVKQEVDELQAKLRAIKSALGESTNIDEATDFRKGDTVHQVGSKLKGTVMHKGNRDEIIVKFGTISKSIPSSQLRLVESVEHENCGTPDCCGTCDESVTLKNFFEVRESRDAAKDLYFNTYSAAIEKAINDTFKKHKLEVDADDYYQKVNMGPGKPGRGKTTRHTLDLVDTKTGKPSRKKLQIQVYNRETDKNPYELNFYVS